MGTVVCTVHQRFSKPAGLRSTEHHRGHERRAGGAVLAPCHASDAEAVVGVGCHAAGAMAAVAPVSEKVRVPSILGMVVPGEKW